MDIKVKFFSIGIILILLFIFAGKAASDTKYVEPVTKYVTSITIYK